MITPVEAESHSTLRSKLTISPKTATLLLGAGYTDYRALQHISTNTLLSQLAQQPGMDTKQVQSYRRAVRRMVWIGTQDEPEAMEKRCQNWTNKNLKANGVWVDEFDDLTGRQLDVKFGTILKSL